ncbi:hypothetical protein PNEG_01861 [Pneumocystis murina B123]|uniref:Uncharacterized protein n=1 Tax=Pneumocystis murina (strain B123) TaxID=1069680 RepID=M7NRC3_PNEMU|nr:hypothetical protein PNEG_01861 [Pneumocystis murina B123]EMR09671.1 hypothetical protein PNEG_01861 [Pneumocystis murina B123]
MHYKCYNNYLFNFDKKRLKYRKKVLFIKIIIKNKYISIFIFINLFSSQTKSLQDNIWTYDTFDINKGIVIQFNNKRQNFDVSSTDKNLEKIKKSKVFSVQVKIPFSDCIKDFEKELINYCKPYFHRFFSKRR